MDGASDMLLSSRADFDGRDVEPSETLFHAIAELARIAATLSQFDALVRLSDRLGTMGDAALGSGNHVMPP